MSTRSAQGYGLGQTRFSVRTLFIARNWMCTIMKMLTQGWMAVLPPSLSTKEQEMSPQFKFEVSILSQKVQYCTCTLHQYRTVRNPQNRAGGNNHTRSPFFFFFYQTQNRSYAVVHQAGH